MKKIIGLLLASSFILVACDDTSNASNDTETIITEKSSESSSELTQAEWVEQYGPETATYEDETLTTQYGTFGFKESDYTESLDGSPVVIVRFDYTNTTDENQNIESLIWDYFDGKQVFENTTEATGYLIMDEEEPYYDEYNNTQVEINPGATVSGAYGITLKDNSVPLTLDFKDENGEVIGTKEFVLE
ncbi:DUF5067 domain-containing protein [Carnobacterium mobile]|uniref:DUF5067 domain-containing protein n=1 Tax=Carnobacterium mobile TaxID=2750 RepID=UPI0005547F8C|nr:DUF5067 domain-containing protein [Carnobacterium mobile]